MSAGNESSESFDCFGSRCSVFVTGDGGGIGHAEAALAARSLLLELHDRFTRFEAGSELSLLNADLRAVVPASPEMRRFASVVAGAAHLSDGLVDGTLLREIRDAGYRGDLGEPVPLAEALRIAPARRAASGSSRSRSRELVVDDAAGTIGRPPGVLLDSGGLAKGLFADMVAERLAAHRSFAVDCGGDVRLGGSAGLIREVRVGSPFDADAVLHSFHLASGGIATSGIGRRSWLDAAGAPAHHLLDPSTGRPAYTGVVQATALAPTAAEAEVRAKCAVLGGPEASPGWLIHGGVVVFDDGGFTVAPLS